jgi:hypothetical protein
MTSDTPETDAQLTTFESISKLKKRFVNKTGTVGAEFARKLERERNILIDALEYIAGLDSSQAACAELCSAVGVAAKALEDME